MAFMEGLLGKKKPFSRKRIRRMNQVCKIASEQKYWNNLLWTEDTKLVKFDHHAQHHVCQNQIDYYHKHLIPAVILVVEGMVIWVILLQPQHLGSTWAPDIKPIEMLWQDHNEMCMNEWPQNSINNSNVVLRHYIKW